MNEPLPDNRADKVPFNKAEAAKKINGNLGKGGIPAVLPVADPNNGQRLAEGTDVAFSEPAPVVHTCNIAPGQGVIRLAFLEKAPNGKNYNRATMAMEYPNFLAIADAFTKIAANIRGSAEAPASKEELVKADGEKTATDAA